jgi:hypothetical protein
MTDGEMHDCRSVSQWMAIRNRYQEATFHFIAIGEANSELLQKMAIASGGNYQEVFE